MDDAQILKIIEQAAQAAAQAHNDSEKVLAQQINTLVKRVEKHDETLYGNGHEGLTSIVERLERTVSAAADVWNKVVTALVIGLVIGLIILVVQAGLLR